MAEIRQSSWLDDEFNFHNIILSKAVFLIRKWFTSNQTRFYTLFLMLMALRLPFYFTRHVQEDAYISLRSAVNLALTGVYGFNAGESVSASTSHLYVFMAAAIRWLVGESAFIPVVLIINTALFLFGTWFIARTFMSERHKQELLWIFLSVIPISLLTSYSGMETSMLVFVIGALLYFMHTARYRWLVLSGLAALPWIRPDAAAFALLLVFWDVVRRKQMRWPETLAVAIGGVSLLAFNQIYFGAWLHQSIAAKSLMRHDFTLERFFGNLTTVFVGEAGGFLAPIRTRFFGQFGILFVIIVLAAIGFTLWQKRGNRDQWINACSFASLAILIPIAYAFGGVIYQWYFWPSAILAAAFPLSLLAAAWDSEKRGWPQAARAGVVVLFIAGIVAQLVFSYAWGMKEFAYRGGIGTWLKENAAEDDRIFLEPAGYIPFYSNLYTYDEVGLVTPQVVTYRQAYDLRWWPEFVMDFKPDWIIQRGHIMKNQTYQGYELNDEEMDWFNENYRLSAHFSFKPEDFATSPNLIRLLTFGEADDYYIFRRLRK